MKYSTVASLRSAPPHRKERSCGDSVGKWLSVTFWIILKFGIVQLELELSELELTDYLVKFLGSFSILLSSPGSGREDSVNQRMMPYQ